MRLDVGHLLRLDASLAQRLAQHGLLRQSVWHSETAAEAILVDRAAADEGVDAAAAGKSVRQPFDNEEDDALAARITICAGVERFAQAIWGEEFVQADGVGRGEDQVAPADQRQAALTAAQAVAGGVQGDERRGAGGINCQARAVQVEGVGDAVGGDAERIALDEIVVNQGRVGCLGRDLQPPVVVQPDANEDARGAPGQAGWDDPGVFQRFPANFQRQALLWIHGIRFARRDAEEMSVKLINLLQKTAAQTLHTTAFRRRFADGAAPFP